MSNIIGIINYGLAGNIYSIEKAIKKAGGETIIINTKEDIFRADKIVIPGVGSFKDAMKELENDNLLNTLKGVLNDKPILGICLGMQILSTIGFEYGETKGLGAIKAEVKPILTNAKIPHVGFNKIKIIKPNKLLKNIEDKEFYFMHSYELINKDDISATTVYSGYQFISAINKKNIYGVQFHPEKSREAGIELFKNFINL